MFSRTAIVLFIGCCTITILRSQAQPNNILSVPGKIGNYSGKEGPPNVLNNSGLDVVTVNTMKTYMLKINGVAESCSDFQQPKGFDLHVQISVDRSSPYEYPVQHVITADSWFAIHELYKNENGKTVANEETGAGLFIKANCFLKLFPDESGGACDEFQLPRFFFKRNFVIKDSTGGYLVLENGTRIITNGRPLYIAYTREQYLQFLIKEKVLEEQKKALQDLKDMKERAATAPDGHKVTAADENNEKYSYMLVILNNAGKNITAAQNNVSQVQQKLTALNAQLKNIPAEEKHKQAYMYFNTDAYAEKDENGKAKDADKYFELTTESDPHGMAVCTPNPAYFNAALPKTSLQLIAIVKDVDTRFVQGPYIRIIDRVSDCIDYKALKSMIQY
ncbi:hypothetical protein A3860_08625 [Niastella vici]|uniref:Uncharacterized protein n=1 Tax=Niastella vici TaxID=1703345 RepID=A0A1V9FHK4_9BACT|nr:hypothetical protein [Niastella vici]OQP57686.1 hypothetical protein A3860_08625 [Niastella vici]